MLVDQAMHTHFRADYQQFEQLTRYPKRWNGVKEWGQGQGMGSGSRNGVKSTVDPGQGMGSRNGVKSRVKEWNGVKSTVDPCSKLIRVKGRLDPFFFLI